jgi:hypothetical protein
MKMWLLPKGRKIHIYLYYLGIARPLWDITASGNHKIETPTMMHFLVLSSGFGFIQNGYDHVIY